MGATGSAYFERWMSSDNDEHEKYTTLHEKIIALEHKHDVFAATMQSTLSEMIHRVDAAEKRASTMIFQQQEPECDIVIIQ
jgi:hypothetical protein